MRNNVTMGIVGIEANLGYSITLSARNSVEFGTLMPSVLAVLSFTASSNLRSLARRST
jgi:hypothetical protein